MHYVYLPVFCLASFLQTKPCIPPCIVPIGTVCYRVANYVALPGPCRYVVIQRVSLPSQLGTSGGGWAGSSTEAKLTSTNEVPTVQLSHTVATALET